jgi:hypothetical protein
MISDLFSMPSMIHSKKVNSSILYKIWFVSNFYDFGIFAKPFSFSITLMALTLPFKISIGIESPLMRSERL